MKKTAAWLVGLAVLALALAGCGAAMSTPSGAGDRTLTPVGIARPASVTPFEIRSAAFELGQAIPAVYSCDGKNTSPALQWDEPPSGTRSLALIMDDPDAPRGTFVHWVVYDLPAGARSLPEAVPAQPELADGTRQGSNGAGKIGYTGPCPPSGVHRYFFTLYALDAPTGLAAGAGKEQVLDAMQGHILAEGELWGTYTRQK